MPGEEKETHTATEHVHVHHRDDKPVAVPAVYVPPLLHTHMQTDGGSGHWHSSLFPTLTNIIYHLQQPLCCVCVCVFACVESLTWSSTTITLIRKELITTEKNVALSTPGGKIGTAATCPFNTCHLTQTHTHTDKHTSRLLLRIKPNWPLTFPSPCFLSSCSACLIVYFMPSTSVYLAAQKTWTQNSNQNKTSWIYQAM